MGYTRLLVHMEMDNFSVVTVVLGQMSHFVVLS